MAKQIRCSNCDTSYNMEEKYKPVKSPKHEDLIETYIECPNCKKKTTIVVTNMTIRQFQQDLVRLKEKQNKIHKRIERDKILLNATEKEISQTQKLVQAEYARINGEQNEGR